MISSRFPNPVLFLTAKVGPLLVLFFIPFLEEASIERMLELYVSLVSLRPYLRRRDAFWTSHYL